MIDLQEMYEWRWKDESNGLVLPYYTRPCLDWLQSIDLKDKTVFEYGLGASTIWYADKCKRVYGVEHNFDWFLAVTKETVPNKFCALADIPFQYMKSIASWGEVFDIIVVDGLYRDECILISLSFLKKGGYLIVDNWNQPSADYIPSDRVQSILSLEFNHSDIYNQPGHEDWKTAVFYN